MRREETKREALDFELGQAPEAEKFEDVLESRREQAEIRRRRVEDREFDRLMRELDGQMEGNARQLEIDDEPTAEDYDVELDQARRRGEPDDGCDSDTTSASRFDADGDYDY
jgi:hypothetical protein